MKRNSTMVKNKGGRPKIDNPVQLRSKRISFAVTPAEMMLLRARLRQAGKTATEYCREAVFNAEVRGVLSEEDRYMLINLHKLGQRVNQLFIQGSLKTDIVARTEYDAFVAEFRRIKNYFSDKITKR